MLANVPGTQSAVNFLVNASLTKYFRSHVLALCHILNTIYYVYIRFCPILLQCSVRMCFVFSAFIYTPISSLVRDNNNNSRQIKTVSISQMMCSVHNYTYSSTSHSSCLHCLPVLSFYHMHTPYVVSHEHNSIRNTGKAFFLHLFQLFRTIIV
jgi:hypothetical protein